MTIQLSAVMDKPLLLSIQARQFLTFKTDTVRMLSLAGPNAPIKEAVTRMTASTTTENVNKERTPHHVFAASLTLICMEDVKNHCTKRPLAYKTAELSCQCAGHRNKWELLFKRTKQTGSLWWEHFTAQLQYKILAQNGLRRCYSLSYL